jgi:hypothetical protein
MIIGSAIIILSKKRGPMPGLFNVSYLYFNLLLKHVSQFSDNCTIFHNTDMPSCQNQSMAIHPACWLS